MSAQDSGGMERYYTEMVFLNFLRGLGIDSKESVPPAYVAWRAGTTTLLGSQPPQIVLKFQYCTLRTKPPPAAEYKQTANRQQTALHIFCNCTRLNRFHVSLKVRQSSCEKITQILCTIILLVLVPLKLNTTFIIDSIAIKILIGIANKKSGVHATKPLKK